MARTTEAQQPGATDRYLELVKRHPPRPIRSEEELDHALAVVNELIDQGDLGADEADYLDVLSDLVARYEAVFQPMPPASNQELLRHLIEARGDTLAAVAAGAGISESTLSEILMGNRDLDRWHIEALAKYFHVQPTVFGSNTSPTD